MSRKKKNGWVKWAVMVAILAIGAVLLLPNLMRNGANGNAAGGAQGAGQTAGQAAGTAGSQLAAGKFRAGVPGGHCGHIVGRWQP